MYPKYKTERLIKRKVPKLLKFFKLEDWTINFHVFKEGSKEAKKILKKSLCKGYCGLTYLGANKTADIVIFYGHKSEKATYSTIIHELLHCAIHELTSNVTLLQEKADKDEEDFVIMLEKILIEVL